MEEPAQTGTGRQESQVYGRSALLEQGCRLDCAMVCFLSKECLTTCTFYIYKWVQSRFFFCFELQPFFVRTGPTGVV